MSTQLTNDSYIITLEARGIDSYLQYTGDAYSADLTESIAFAANEVTRRIKDAVTAWYGMYGICVLVMPKRRNIDAGLHANGDMVALGSEAASIASACVASTYKHPYDKHIIFRAVVKNITSQTVVKAFSDYQCLNLCAFLQRLTTLHIGKAAVKGKSNHEMVALLSSIGVDVVNMYPAEAYRGALINTQSLAPSQVVIKPITDKWINSFRSTDTDIDFFSENYDLIGRYMQP